MHLEESHSKQTPNLNNREWGLHQTEHSDSLPLTCISHRLTHHPLPSP